LIGFDDPVGPNDITSVREIPLDNGNILRAYRENPYGFVRFKLDKGQIPEWMRGDYTSYYEADKAIQQYLAQRQMEAEKIPVASNKFDKKEK
jgi:hypothetical protein